MAAPLQAYFAQIGVSDIENTQTWIRVKPSTLFRNVVKSLQFTDEDTLRRYLAEHPSTRYLADSKSAAEVNNGSTLSPAQRAQSEWAAAVEDAIASVSATEVDPQPISSPTSPAPSASPTTASADPAASTITTPPASAMHPLLRLDPATWAFALERYPDALALLQANLLPANINQGIFASAALGTEGVKLYRAARTAKSPKRVCIRARESCLSVLMWVGLPERS